MSEGHTDQARSALSASLQYLDQSRGAFASILQDLPTLRSHAQVAALSAEQAQGLVAQAGTGPEQAVGSLVDTVKVDGQDLTRRLIEAERFAEESMAMASHARQSVEEQIARLA